MKKRKILLGFLLAGAAFSFAACTNNKDANKNDDKSSDTSGDSGDQGGQGGQTEKVTVTFNANNGSTNTTAQVDKGGKVTKPSNPEKAADAQYTYAFEGWYKDTALTQAFNFDTETVSAALTLYAKYTATPIQTQVNYLALFVDASGVTKVLEDGDHISFEGLVVTALDENANTVTVPSTAYTITVKDSTDNTFDIANAVVGGTTYVATISAGDVTADDTITFTVKASQYKFAVPLSCDDYNNSRGENKVTTGEFAFASDTKVYESKAFDITMGTGVKIQVTDSNNNPVSKTYDGKTYDSRFQINTGAKKMVFTAKASGSLTLLFQTDATRKIVASDGTKDFTSEAPTAENKNEIHEFTFDVEKGKSYDINSSTNGSNIYAMIFNGSVDADSVVATDDLFLKPSSTEFTTTDNKFNTANPNGLTIIAQNNYGQERTIAAADCTIVVKNSSDQTVTGEITEAGEYTVSVTYDGKTESYTISVVDPTAVITALDINSTDATKTFYEGKNGTFNADDIVVTATKGVATITLSSSEYTVELLKGSDVVTEFTTSGTYTVRITSTENTTVSSTYTVTYNTIDSTTITAAEAMDVAIGTTQFVHNASAEGTYTDSTKINLTSSIVCKLYSDSACQTELTDQTAAFAAAGTVYAKLTCGNATPVVITLTVKNISTFTWSAESISADGKKDKDPFAAGALDSFFTLCGSSATVRVNSAGTKVTSIELGKKFTSYIEFTVTGAATITIKAASTGGESTTTGFGVYSTHDTYDPDKGTAPTIVAGNTAQSASGTGGTDLTFTVSEAGTYYIGYTETARNGRILSVTVSLS